LKNKAYILDNSPFSLRDKVILITGASSGIGRQCGITCSQMGASVILLGRNNQKLKETHSLLSKGDHDLYSIDITNFDLLEDIVKDAVAKHGGLFGFIHSAGIDFTIPLANMTVKKYEEIFKINVVAGLELAKIISKKKYTSVIGGSFIFISSVMGVLGQPGRTAYCSSKGAIQGAVKAMAIELASRNIRVNAVLPAMVDTEMARTFFVNIGEEASQNIIKMHPLGIGAPADVANACSFLLSDAARWITGTNFIVDGGYSSI
jgi:NAD(P)-dependent dehydrogenase (short-subunit alcohol dehydrogenase family)